MLRPRLDLGPAVSRMYGGPEDGRPVQSGMTWIQTLKPERIDSFAFEVELHTVRGRYTEELPGMYLWNGWEGSTRQPRQHATRIPLDSGVDMEWAENEFRADVERQAAERYMAVAWDTLRDEVYTSHETRRITEPIFERRWSWRRWRWEDVATGERTTPTLDFVQYRTLRVYSYPKEF